MSAIIRLVYVVTCFKTTSEFNIVIVPVFDETSPGVIYKRVMDVIDASLWIDPQVAALRDQLRSLCHLRNCARITRCDEAA